MKEKENFEDCYMKYGNKIYKVAYKMLNNHQDAVDIVQEVFLRLYKNWHNFKGLAKITTYLYRIAINLSYDYLRKKSKAKIYKDLNYENLPYENNFFDAIVCLDVIEHIINPFHLLAEIKRVLKPQGVLILTTPNFRKIKNILYLLIIGKFPKTSTDISFWDGGHLHYFTFKDIKWLLECHGFSIVSKGYIFTKEKYVIFKFFLEKLLPKNLFSEFIASGILVKAVKNP